VVVGQAQAIGLLRRAVATGRIAHAYAFLGPAGVGRRLVALGFAQACLCPEGGCGRCRACRRVAAGIHPDCEVLAPTAPRDNPGGALALRIEQVRELGHRAALAPFEGPWKVFILDEADRMTLPTAQALLKTLEEPPPRTILILILANPRALPPTVLSRCQRVRFRPLTVEDATALLAARDAPAETAGLLARLCRGQVGLVQEVDLAPLLAVRAAALALLEVPAPGLALRLDERPPDRASVTAWLDVYWLWFRDALCLAAGADDRCLVNADRRADLAALAGRVPLGALIEAVETLKEAWLALEGNVNPRLVLEATLLRLAPASAA
jgi:DNA polymerase-3 subunit delta'